MTEAQWMDKVIDTAHLYGWTVAHFRAARTAHGWRTPVAADGAGFPDLVLAHPAGGVLFRELKTDRGHLTAEQDAWRVVIHLAGGDAGVWRPADWDTVHATLAAVRRVTA